MAGNIIRLNNGGTIQVRTGVLQGIGPIGPPGPIGPQGVPGPDGPQGETGPMGAIAKYAMKAKVSSPITVDPDTDTLVGFSNVSYDDLNAHQSSTNYVVEEGGDYSFNVWVKYEIGADAGDGIRSLWLTSSVQGELIRVQIQAVADDATYVQLSWPDRLEAGETINVYTEHSDNLALSLSDGAFSIVRIGSGPRGLTGPQGPQGSVGPTGPQGAQGVPGSPGTYATYGDLHG